MRRELALCLPRQLYRLPISIPPPPKSPRCGGGSIKIARRVAEPGHVTCRSADSSTHDWRQVSTVRRVIGWFSDARCGRGEPRQRKLRQGQPRQRKLRQRLHRPSASGAGASIAAPAPLISATSTGSTADALSAAAMPPDHLLASAMPPGHFIASLPSFCACGMPSLAATWPANTCWKIGITACRPASAFAPVSAGAGSFAASMNC